MPPTSGWPSGSLAFWLRLLGVLRGVPFSPQVNYRSPSSALSHPSLGEGSPTKIGYRKKVGTLIF